MSKIFGLYNLHTSEWKKVNQVVRNGTEWEKIEEVSTEVGTKWGTAGRFWKSGGLGLGQKKDMTVPLQINVSGLKLLAFISQTWIAKAVYVTFFMSV